MILLTGFTSLGENTQYSSPLWLVGGVLGRWWERWLVGGNDNILVFIVFHICEDFNYVRIWQNKGFFFYRFFSIIQRTQPHSNAAQVLFNMQQQYRAHQPSFPLALQSLELGEQADLVLMPFVCGSWYRRRQRYGGGGTKMKVGNNA